MSAVTITDPDQLAVTTSAVVDAAKAQIAANG